MWGTVTDALRRYKGSPGVETAVRRAKAQPESLKTELPLVGEGRLPQVRINYALAKELAAAECDVLYITDTRWWLGGLRSAHTIVGND